MPSANLVREEPGLCRPQSDRLGKLQILGMGVLLLMAVVVYYPVHNYPFIDLDDAAFIYANPHVMGPLNFSAVVWAFTHPFGYLYVPLTFFSHSLDVHLLQLHAGGQHEINVLLHALNALLLFRLLTRATGYVGRSFMVAALFTAHPIHVEAVTWIAERKTVLSTVFFWLALYAYRWYAADPERRRMRVVAALYILGLLAKPQVIALPFVFLLWDYWPLRRMFPRSRGDCSGVVTEPMPPATFLALLKEKIVLFVIAAVDALLTMIAQHRFDKPQETVRLPIRIENSFIGYVQYLGKAFYPTNLSMEYVYPGNAPNLWALMGALLLLLGISALVIANWRRRYPLVGWLWFVGLLAPMIGILVSYPQPIADRYAYIAFIGLFLMLCWSAAEWAEAWHLPRAVLPVTGCVVVLALTATAHHQVGYWKNSETLWTHVLEMTHHNYVADLSLGALEQQRGHLDKALEHYYRTAYYSPHDYRVNLAIAQLEYQRHNLRQAIQHYEKALAASPDNPENPKVYTILGHAYAEAGDLAGARNCYLAARRPVWSPPPPEINWRGAWWWDLARVAHERYDEWRSGPPQ